MNGGWECSTTIFDALASGFLVESIVFFCLLPTCCKNLLHILTKCFFLFSPDDENDDNDDDYDDDDNDGGYNDFSCKCRS